MKMKKNKGEKKLKRISEVMKVGLELLEESFKDRDINMNLSWNENEMAKKEQVIRRSDIGLTRNVPSIDMLDDDCLAIVLTYLSMQDKCKLEHVNSRWKKLMHINVDRIRIGMDKEGKHMYLIEIDKHPSRLSSKVMYYALSKDNIKLLMKKCQSIKTILIEEIKMFGETYQIVVEDNRERKSCEDIMEYYLSLLNVFDFMKERINKIELDLDMEMINKTSVNSLIMSKCPNLTHFGPIDLIKQFPEEVAASMQDLKSLSAQIFNREEIACDQFYSFCDDYGHRLEELHLNIVAPLMSEDIISLIVQIGKMRDLIYCSLELNANNMRESELELTEREIGIYKRLTKIPSIKKLIFIYSDDIIHKGKFDLGPILSVFILPLMIVSCKLEYLEIKIDVNFRSSRLPINTIKDYTANVKELVMTITHPGTSNASGFYTNMQLAFPNLIKLTILDDFFDSNAIIEFIKLSSLKFLHLYPHYWHEDLLELFFQTLCDSFTSLNVVKINLGMFLMIEEIYHELMRVGRERSKLKIIIIDETTAQDAQQSDFDEETFGPEGDSVLKEKTEQFLSELQRSDQLWMPKNVNIIYESNYKSSINGEKIHFSS